MLPGWDEMEAVHRQLKQLGQVHATLTPLAHRVPEVEVMRDASVVGTMGSLPKKFDSEHGVRVPLVLNGPYRLTDTLRVVKIQIIPRIKR